MVKQTARLDREAMSGSGVVDVSVEDAVLIQKAALVALIQMSPEERLAKASLPERYTTEHLRAVYQNLPEFDAESLKARVVIMRAACLVRETSDPVGSLSCECGDVFAKHEKPPLGTSWDACSFPCLRCPCQEFRETSIAGSYV